MSLSVNRVVRAALALFVALAVFTPATAQAACASACGPMTTEKPCSCGMHGGTSPVAAMPAGDMPAAMPDSCCAPGGDARIGACGHDTSPVPTISIQPAETSGVTVTTVALDAAVVGPTRAVGVTQAEPRPPGGVADGTRLRI